MRHYCTYFDLNFLSRGLLLLASLKRHEADFILYALCLDEEVHAVIQRLNDPRFIPLTLGELEAADARLPAARANRSRIEYFFTLSPFLPLYILRTHPHIPRITYVDADCRFYSSPQPIFDELADKSVLIIEHRFSPHEQERLKFGRYNVGLLTFRNDTDGLACLERWAGQCAAWCYDRMESGKFADQKYLDDWPTACRGVHVLQHKGVNLAPWNAANFKLSRRAGTLWVDDAPLVLYHFHGLCVVEREKFWPSIDYAGLGPEHIYYLYMPYVQALVNVSSEHKIPSGPYGRKRLSDTSGPTVSLRVTPWHWPMPFWLAGWRWYPLWAARRRQAVLDDIIQAFHARDRKTCRARLRAGLLRHPRLLLNRHVWNVLFRCLQPRPTI
jgi:hypothetical protein